jgi:hypothetical protein
LRNQERREPAGGIKEATKPPPGNCSINIKHWGAVNDEISRALKFRRNRNTPFPITASGGAAGDSDAGMALESLPLQPIRAPLIQFQCPNVGVYYQLISSIHRYIAFVAVLVVQA